MTVALRGNLRDFGIAEVFQLIGQQRKTGFLDITADAQTMRLAFDAGRVVWARPVGVTEDVVVGERLVRCGLLMQPRLMELQRESEHSARAVGTLAVDSEILAAADLEQIEELITDETIFTVLRWSVGSFDFSAQAIGHDRPPDKLLAAEEILMDGLRRVDEWGTFAALVPSGDTIFERSGGMDAYRRKLGQEGRQRLQRIEKIYALVDGRLPVQRVIDLSRLGLFDGTRALAELHRDQLITPLTGMQARLRARKRESDTRPVAERVRWWIAAAFPVALLGLVTSIILNDARVADSSEVFPIDRAPLRAARAVFEKRRLRHALEAQHMLWGRWPETLDEPDQTRLLGRPTLAAADDAAYYYVRRGNGILLLAPER